MACADVDMDISAADVEPRRVGGREPLLIRHYKATEIIPDNKGPLHDLLQKQPAVLGSLQVMSGLFSVGIGIIFAATQEIGKSLFTLFRVSHLTGTLFIAAGVVTNLLFKYPMLLPVSLMINFGCFIVAVVAAFLIVIDLARFIPESDEHWKMELLELCVLMLEVLLSAVLCILFYKEKRAKSL